MELGVKRLMERAIWAQFIMQMTDAFWGDRWGQLRDPFGHIWSIATHKKDVAPEEMEKAAKEEIR